MFKIRPVDAPFRSVPPAGMGEVAVGSQQGPGAGPRGAAQGLLAPAQDSRLSFLGR